MVPTEGWLVTIDVVSLYTSIEHQKGIEAVRGLLSTSDYSIQQQNFVMELLEIVLYENFFLFRDQFFIQKRGTAMGSNVAPPYANCYMSDFEERFVYINPLYCKHAINMQRFIDDIFCVW